MQKKKNDFKKNIESRKLDLLFLEKNEDGEIIFNPDIPKKETKVVLNMTSKKKKKKKAAPTKKDN